MLVVKQQSCYKFPCYNEKYDRRKDVKCVVYSNLLDVLELFLWNLFSVIMIRKALFWPNPTEP